MGPKACLLRITPHRAQEYEEAVQMYSRGLSLHPNAVLYNNRAAAFLRLHRAEEAVDDATTALKLQPDFVKAIVRRAAARVELAKAAEGQAARDLACDALGDCLDAKQLGCTIE